MCRLFLVFSVLKVGHSSFSAHRHKSFDISQIIYHISSVIRQSFSFQNNTKDLDPSCNTDLDLWDCLGRGKLV